MYKYLNYIKLYDLIKNKYTQFIAIFADYPQSLNQYLIVSGRWKEYCTTWMQQ